MTSSGAGENTRFGNGYDFCGTVGKGMGELSRDFVDNASCCCSRVRLYLPKLLPIKTTQAHNKCYTVSKDHYRVCTSSG
jgi:hypothetical protein